MTSIDRRLLWKLRRRFETQPRCAPPEKRMSLRASWILTWCNVGVSLCRLNGEVR
jgi:hypothetical protein